MRLTLGVIILVSTVAGAFGQSQDGSSEFARIAGAPASTVIYQQSMGYLADGRSKVEVSALVVRGADAPTPTVRGIRVDFSDAHSRSTTYISQAGAGEEKRILEQIADHGDESTNRLLRLAWRGSCEFRDHPERFPIQVNFLYGGPGSPAMRIDTANHTMMLYDHTPSELSSLFDKALRSLGDK